MNGILLGTLIGFLTVILTHIPLGSTSDGSKITLMYHWSSALLTVISIPLMSVFLLKYGFKKLDYAEPSLKYLLPVSFLTFLIPVFFSAFGAPNSNLLTLVQIILLGGIGGMFWSTPYSLRAFFKRKDDSSE